MKWVPYAVTLSLRSPIHIGWRKVGNLQQTRSYVTGRVLWGALTARLVRDGETDRSQKVYDIMGEEVDKYLRFSYFFPVIAGDSKLDLQDSQGWPWEGSGSFDWRFLDSYMGSPISGEGVSERGGLHETEYIMPYSRDGRQVYLQGYIFEKQNSPEHIRAWKGTLNQLQLGGERTYGWGRVSCEECSEKNTSFFGNLSLSLDEEEGPIIILKKEQFLVSHVIVEGSLDIKGAIEVFTGRKTDKKAKPGFGGSFYEAGACWMPGSRVTGDRRFLIDNKGIWKAC